MDSNSDGVIDASDEAFGQLKVWQDADGVAEVDEGEMRSLKEAGITGFDFDSYKANLGTITRLNDEGDEVEEQIERLKIGAAELHGVSNYTKSSTDEDGAVETGIAGDVGFEYFRDGFRIDRDEDGGFDIVFEDGAQGNGVEVISAEEDPDFRLDGLSDQVVQGDERGNRIDAGWVQGASSFNPSESTFSLIRQVNAGVQVRRNTPPNSLKLAKKPANSNEYGTTSPQNIFHL